MLSISPWIIQYKTSFLYYYHRNKTVKLQNISSSEGDAGMVENEAYTTMECAGGDKMEMVQNEAYSATPNTQQTEDYEYICIQHNN